jgi:quinol monooxygenase YgiN
MYCILLEFRPVPGKEEKFLRSWAALTEYIHQNYGSKGSRMHRSESGKFIAYAQWPGKETYESVSGTEEGARLREAMLEFLQENGITVLEKLEVVEDMLER